MDGDNSMALREVKGEGHGMCDMMCKVSEGEEKSQRYKSRSTWRCGVVDTEVRLTT